MTHAERKIRQVQELEAHADEVMFLYEKQRLTLRALAREMKTRGCTFSYRCLHEWLKERGYVRPQGSPKGHGRSGKPVRKKPCVICHELFLPESSGHCYCKVCIPHEMAWHYYKHYGLTHLQFTAMCEAQQGNCAGCGCEISLKRDKTGKEVIFVDHCHRTGVIRGMLCRACNHILGLAKDNPETLRCLIAYLESFAERFKKQVA